MDASKFLTCRACRDFWLTNGPGQREYRPKRYMRISRNQEEHRGHLHIYLSSKQSIISEEKAGSRTHISSIWRL